MGGKAVFMLVEGREISGFDLQPEATGRIIDLIRQLI